MLKEITSCTDTFLAVTILEFSLSVEFAKDFTVNFDHSAPPVTKVALQLLGNVCVGQTTGQEAVWKVAFPQLFRYRTNDAVCY